MNGQAVLVAYHIYAGPDGTVPQISGVPRRCEFGQEICITLAHQHYGETLAALLDKDEFAGVLVSDNAAVYQGLSCSQKCWAHRIRKAIMRKVL